MRRKLITEKKQENSNIELKCIYEAIKHLKPEHQVTIFSNYKFTELYDILANNENYRQYIDDLFVISNEYIKMAAAISSLRTEALLQSMKKQEEFDPAATMCQLFDCMSEADKKRFCEGMLQKKEFYEDVHKAVSGDSNNTIKRDLQEET